MIVDAWLHWSYSALGGELLLRGGRQEVVVSPIAMGRNDFLLVPPRYDGLRASLAVWKFFGMAFLGLEALTQSAEPFPPINVVSVAQAGLMHDELNLMEGHVLARIPNAPVHGDAQQNSAGRTRVTVGGHAEWNVLGLHGTLGLDAQQERFSMPSALWPALAGVLSAGYAPTPDWALGARVEAGVRGGMGQPLTYMPLVGSKVDWSGVPPMEFSAQSSAKEGRFGEMDLGTLYNMYDLYFRVGIAREGLRQLSITLHRLALFNARGEWLNARSQTLLKNLEGGPDPRVGYEIDLSSAVDLTRHVTLSGAVGLLASSAKAREAGFGTFAQTAYLVVDFRL
jgi:hypothetical protein